MAARIIAVAQQKGGAGKTTVAAQLAVAWARAGLTVAALDIDPQGSLAAWGNARRAAGGGEDAPSVLALSGWKLGTELQKLRHRCDLVVVDTAPHAETDARTAIRAADLVLVPVQPSPMDLWAIGPTLDLAGRENSTLLLTLNRVPPRGRISEAVQHELARLGPPVAQASLGNRAAFAASMMAGRGVVETAPRSTAADEIRALATEVAERIGAQQA